MTDFSNALSAVRRPKILIRAARAGLGDYRRDRDLKRVLRGQSTGHDRAAIVPLLAEEHRIECQRIAGDATYSVQKHISVLTALIAEGRLHQSRSNRSGQSERAAAHAKAGKVIRFAA